MNKNQTNINILIKSAEALIEAKRYEDAMKGYCKIVEVDQTHSENWLILGECLVILGRDKEAIKAFDGCLMIDDPYDIPAFYQAAMAYSRLGDWRRASDYHDKALSVDKRMKQNILDQCLLSNRLEIIGRATEVYINIKAWHWDYGRNKVGSWSFKWTDEYLFFMYGSEPRMIGRARTQDMAQKVAECWLDGWLKHCHSVHGDLDIEGVETRIVFCFLLRDKKNMGKGEFIFLWEDEELITPGKMSIGHSEIKTEAFQIAHEWLRRKIWDKSVVNSL